LTLQDFLTALLARLAEPIHEVVDAIKLLIAKMKFLPAETFGAHAAREVLFVKLEGPYANEGLIDDSLHSTPVHSRAMRHNQTWEWANTTSGATC